MRATRLRAAMAAALCAGTVYAGSALADEPYAAVLGNFMISPDSSNRVPSLDTGLGLDVRYGGFMDVMGFPLEARIFYDRLEPEFAGVSDLFQAGAGADLLYPLGDVIGTAFGISPFALAGAGAVYSDAVPSLDAEFGLLANVGAGALWSPAPDSAWRLRGELRYVYQTLEGGYLDLNALLGVEIPLGMKEAKRDEPVRVVRAPRAAPKDTDGDGVNDDRDACPGTPAGTTVDAAGCPPARILTLKGVTFELNSDELRPESYAVLDAAAEKLITEFPKARIEVAGHTDSTGDADYNLDLSKRRARSVRAYLIERGVEAGRLTAIGYGQTEPIADNESREGRAENRRVELRVRD